MILEHGFGRTARTKASRGDSSLALGMTRSLAPILLMALLAGCATATAPAPAPPVPASPSLPSAAAAAEPAPPSSLHWTRTAAEHRAAFLQTYRSAAGRLEELVAGRDPWTWAVVLDADETLIDNSTYQKERADQGLGYSRESWAEWVNRRAADALPGGRDFLETVRGLGGRIAVVTNRDDDLCAATADNLRSERLPYDIVLCRPKGGPSEKEPRWEAVERGTATPELPPVEIVMWIGDNIGDFPGATQELRNAPESDLARFGDRWWVLPNPMYGSWERNPPR